MKLCFRCNTEWEGIGQPSPKEICQKCLSDLHVCKNCMFYDTTKPHECREDIEEYIIYKDRANFCDKFRFKDVSNKNKDEVLKNRLIWEKLFNKKDL